MPPQAQEDSPEGAAAFVKHYIDVFNYAASTGDVDELSRLSSPDCEPCNKYADRFEQIYSNGDRISETLWTLRDEPLKLTGSIDVTAPMNVQEGAIKPYDFKFRLPHQPPFHVQNIVIADQP